jgi:hypothetical protein
VGDYRRVKWEEGEKCKGRPLGAFGFSSHFTRRGFAHISRRGGRAALFKDLTAL